MDSKEAPQKSEGKPLTIPASRAPFNHLFFQTIFAERLRSVCHGHSEEVPVVLLQLTDDRELDLCHIELVAPQWMAVAVFRDGPTCEAMDTVFVPYEMVTRVTISRRNSRERHLGFQAERPIPMVLDDPAEALGGNQAPVKGRLR